MSLPKRKLREIVFQLLFSHDLTHMMAEETLPLVMEQTAVAKSNIHLAYQHMQSVVAHKDELDALLKEGVEEYDFSRIHRVERSVLRLMLFEATYEGLAKKVAIAEGVRLARKFGAPEAGSFVNAVLDRVINDSNPPEEEKQEIYFGPSGDE